MNENTVQTSLNEILRNYVDARNSKPFTAHELRKYFEQIEGALGSIPAISKNPNLKIKWSTGQGNWAKVPWIAVVDSRETDSIQKGIYCTYLFRQDMSGVYLTFNQGVVKLINEKGKPEAYKILGETANELRSYSDHLVEMGFKMDGSIDLKVDQGLGADYQRSTIAHKFYALGDLPEDEILISDLDSLITAYQKYVENRKISSALVASNDEAINELIKKFEDAAVGSALRTASALSIRFASACLSKQFLISTGLAGSGKTKLAQAFSRWIAPVKTTGGLPNPHYALVPVGADWTGNENILGYPNALEAGSYVSKPALDLMLQAMEHPDTPHFLILDEMNLSHVERYFADILSLIESGEGLELYSGDMGQPAAWRKTAALKPVPPKLRKLPDNLFIIGTVNVDETTYMFSPKVLDRANVIEFRMNAGELEHFLKDPAKPDLSLLDGKGAGFGRAFVDAARSPALVPAEVKAQYDAEMLLLFKALAAHGAEFGYRTAYETSRFIHFYKLLGQHADDNAKWFSDAFDCVILQKLLPKLHGSRARLGPVLKKLWFLCVTRGQARGADALKAAAESKLEPGGEIPEGAPYPLSAEKIGRMWRLLSENGFASFAEA